MKLLKWAWLLAIGMATGATVQADEVRSVATLANRCAMCHGPQGESASPIYPRLAAQNAEYMAKQLKDFRDGRRRGSTMNEMAVDLVDAEIVALAAFYSKKTAKSGRPGEPELAAVGKYLYLNGNRFSSVAACASCHGPKGHGTVQLPRLAGQNAQYLVTQLKEFNQRIRTNDNAVMHSIASKLTELEMAALAAYISSL